MSVAGAVALAKGINGVDDADASPEVDAVGVGNSEVVSHASMESRSASMAQNWKRGSLCLLTIIY